MKRASLSSGKDKGHVTKRTASLRGNEQATPSTTGKLASTRQAENAKSLSSQKASSLSTRAAASARSQSAPATKSHASLKRSGLSSPQSRDSPDGKRRKLCSNVQRGRPRKLSLQGTKANTLAEKERKRMAEMKKLVTTDGFWATSSSFREAGNSKVERRASGSKRASRTSTPEGVSSGRKSVVVSTVSQTTSQQIRPVKSEREPNSAQSKIEKEPAAVSSTTSELKRLQTTDGFWSPSSILSESRDTSPASTSSLERSFRHRSQQKKSSSVSVTSLVTENQYGSDITRLKPTEAKTTPVRPSSAPESLAAGRLIGARGGRSRSSHSRANFVANTLKKNSFLHRSPTRFVRSRGMLPTRKFVKTRKRGQETDSGGADLLSLQAQSEVLKKNLRPRRGEEEEEKEEVVDKTKPDTKTSHDLRKRQPVTMGRKPEESKTSKSIQSKSKEEIKGEKEKDRGHSKRSDSAISSPASSLERKSRKSEAAQERRIPQRRRTRLKSAGSADVSTQVNQKRTEGLSSGIVTGSDSPNYSSSTTLLQQSTSSKLVMSDLLGSGELKRLDTTPGFWAPTPDVSHVLGLAHRRRSPASSPRACRRSTVSKSQLSPKKQESSLLQLRKKKLSVLQKQRQVKQQTNKEEQRANNVSLQTVDTESKKPKRKRFIFGVKKKKWHGILVKKKPLSPNTELPASNYEDGVCAEETEQVMSGNVLTDMVSDTERSSSSTVNQSVAQSDFSNIPVSGFNAESNMSDIMLNKFEVAEDKLESPSSHKMLTNEEKIALTSSEKHPAPNVSSRLVKVSSDKVECPEHVTETDVKTVSSVEAMQKEASANDLTSLVNTVKRTLPLVVSEKMEKVQTVLATCPASDASSVSCKGKLVEDASGKDLSSPAEINDAAPADCKHDQESVKTGQNYNAAQGQHTSKSKSSHASPVEAAQEGTVQETEGQCFEADAESRGLPATTVGDKDDCLESYPLTSLSQSQGQDSSVQNKDADSSIVEKNSRIADTLETDVNVVKTRLGSDLLMGKAADEASMSSEATKVTEINQTECVKENENEARPADVVKKKEMGIKQDDSVREKDVQIKPSDTAKKDVEIEPADSAKEKDIEIKPPDFAKEKDIEIKPADFAKEKEDIEPANSLKDEDVSIKPASSAKEDAKIEPADNMQEKVLEINPANSPMEEDIEIKSTDSVKKNDVGIKPAENEKDVELKHANSTKKNEIEIEADDSVCENELQTDQDQSVTDLESNTVGNDAMIKEGIEKKLTEFARGEGMEAKITECSGEAVLTMRSTDQATATCGEDSKSLIAGNDEKFRSCTNSALDVCRQSVDTASLVSNNNLEGNESVASKGGEDTKVLQTGAPEEISQTFSASKVSLKSDVDASRTCPVEPKVTDVDIVCSVSLQTSQVTQTDQAAIPSQPEGHPVLSSLTTLPEAVHSKKPRLASSPVETGVHKIETAASETKSTSSGGAPVRTVMTKSDPRRKVYKKRRNAWKRGIVQRATKMYRKSALSSENIPSQSTLSEPNGVKDESGVFNDDGEIAPLEDQTLVTDSQNLTNTIRNAKKTAKELRKSAMLRRLQTDANLAGGAFNDTDLRSSGRNLREIVPKTNTKTIPVLRKKIASDVNVIDASHKFKIKDKRSPGRPRKRKRKFGDTLPKLVLSTAPTEGNAPRRWYKTPPRLSPQPMAGSGSPRDQGVGCKYSDFVSESVDDSDLHLYLSGVSDEEPSPAKSVGGSDLRDTYKPIDLADPKAVNGTTEAKEGLDSLPLNQSWTQPVDSATPPKKMKGRKGRPPGIPMTEEEKNKVRSKLIARYDDYASFKMPRTARKSTFTPSLYLAPSTSPFSPKKLSLRQKTTRSPLEMLEMKRKQEEAIYDMEEEKRLAKRINRLEKRNSQASPDESFEEDAEDLEWEIKDCAVVLNDFVKKLHLESIDIPSSGGEEARLDEEQKSEGAEDVSSAVEEDWCANLEDFHDDGDEEWTADGQRREKRPCIPRLKLKRVPKLGKKKVKGHKSKKRPKFICPQQDAQQPLKLVIKTEMPSSCSSEVSARSEPAVNVLTMQRKGFEGSFVDFLQGKTTNEFMNVGTKRAQQFRPASCSSGINNNDKSGVSDGRLIMNLGDVGSLKPKSPPKQTASPVAGPGVTSEQMSSANDDMGAMQSSYTKNSCGEKQNNASAGSEKSLTLSPITNDMEGSNAAAYACDSETSSNITVEVCSSTGVQSESESSKSVESPINNNNNNNNNKVVSPKVPQQMPQVSATSKSSIPLKDNSAGSAVPVPKPPSTSSLPEGWKVKVIHPTANGGVDEEQHQGGTSVRVIGSPRGGTQVAGSVVVAGGDGSGQGGQSPPVVISVLVSSGAATAGASNHGPGVVVRPGNTAPSMGTPASSNRRRYVCTHCGFSTNVRADAEHHVLDLHPSSSIFACSLCKENTYYSDAEIKQHAALVHPSRTRPYRRLPDFYDAEKLSSSAAGCEDGMFELGGSVFPDSHAAEESSPVDHRQRAKDYLQLQEGLKEKRSAEADSTTAADYMECEQQQEQKDQVSSGQLTGSSHTDAEAESSPREGEDSSSSTSAAGQSDAKFTCPENDPSHISSSAIGSSWSTTEDSTVCCDAIKNADCAEQRSSVDLKAVNQTRADESCGSDRSSLKIVEVVSLSNSEGIQDAGQELHESSKGEANSSVSHVDSEESSSISAGQGISVSSSLAVAVPSSSSLATSAAATSDTPSLSSVTTSSSSSSSVPPEADQSVPAPVTTASASSHLGGGLPLSYKCSACRVHTPYLLMMVKHLKAKHPHMGCFSCPYCKVYAPGTEQPESFVTQKQLRTHIRKFHPEKTGRNEIALSARAKQFVEAMVLPASSECIQVGSRLVLEEDIHTCTYCSLKMTSLASVYEHLNEVHADLFEFVCPICQSFKSKDLEEISAHSLEVHLSEVETDKVHVSVPKNLFSVLKCISKGGKYIEKQLDGLNSSSAEATDSSKSSTPAPVLPSSQEPPAGSTTASTSVSAATTLAMTIENASAPLDLTSASHSINRAPETNLSPAVAPPPAHMGMKSPARVPPAQLNFSSSLFDTSSLSIPPQMVVAAMSGSSGATPVPVAAASSFLSPRTGKSHQGKHSNKQTKTTSPAAARALPVLNIPTIKPRPQPPSSVLARQKVSVDEPLRTSFQPAAAARPPAISHTSATSTLQPPQSTRLNLSVTTTSFDDLPDDEPNPDAFKIFNLQPTPPPLVNSPASLNALHSPSPVPSPSSSVVPTVFPPVSTQLSSGFIQGPIVGFPAGMVISQTLLPPHASSSISQQQQQALFYSAGPSSTALSGIPTSLGSEANTNSLLSKLKQFPSASPSSLSGSSQRPKSASAASSTTQLLKEQQKRELFLLKQRHHQQKLTGLAASGFPIEQQPEDTVPDYHRLLAKEKQKQVRMKQLQALQQARQQQQFAHQQQMLQRAVLNQHQHQARLLAQQAQAQGRPFPPLPAPTQAWLQHQQHNQQQQQDNLPPNTNDFPVSSAPLHAPLAPPSSSSSPLITATGSVISPSRPTKGVHKRSSSLYQCPYCPTTVTLKALDVASHIHQKHPGSQVVFKKATAS
ncbi:hypothetical protein ElyMa_005587600 [Elysia marginata]|uniref:C2H2-type domain-containing protein n=1 Tax=Elysia marginata TaxID=1093978 RepID=A0AAV4F2M6_9GAST|nr:hypothetical protein ElyMa_005587600 [Elysia marginata]